MTYGRGAPASSIKLMYVRRRAWGVILGSGRDPASDADLVDAADDWHENPLTHAVLVAGAAARWGEHELIDAGGLSPSPPRIQLLEQVEAQVDLADASG